MAAPQEEGRIFLRDDGTLGFESYRVPPVCGNSSTPCPSSLRALKDIPSTIANAPRDDNNNTVQAPPLPHTIVKSEQHATLHFSMAPKATLPPILDRIFWERRVRIPGEGGLILGKITDRLGLKRSRGTRGPVSFTGDQVRQLADAVAVLASRLPNDATRLVEIALDMGLLVAITNYLLEQFGEKIWGTEKERPWLYEPSDGIEGYTCALRYANENDRTVLNEQLRLWIVIKGINAFTYQKYRPSTTPRVGSKSPRDSDKTLTYNLTTYDRAFWAQKLKVPASSDLSIRTIVKSLNLQRYDTGSHGNVSFKNKNVKALNKCISDIADTITQDEGSLIDMAATPERLQPEVDGLILLFGLKIWGRDKWQRLPMHEDEDDGYDPEDLVYAKPQDRIKIRHYLRLWIVVRAFNSFVYRKYNRVDGTNPSAPQAEHVTGQEEEVVLDDFEDDIQEISGDNWMPSTRVRLKQERITSPCFTLEALQAPFKAVSITQFTTDRAETSHLSDKQDNRDLRMAVSDSDELVQDQVTETLVAPIALHHQQHDVESGHLASSEAADVRKESVLVAGIMSETEKASTQSLQLQLQQPLHPLQVVAGDDVHSEEALVIPAAVLKDKTTVVQDRSARSVCDTRKPVVIYNEANTSGRAIHTPTKYLDSHHKNVVRGPLADIPNGDSYSTPGNLGGHHTKRAGNRLQITEHWDEGTWRRFASASVIPLSTFISSLGMKTRPTSKGDVADHTASSKLIKEINQAAAELYGSLSVDELVKAAVVYTFLDEKITVLLDEYAPLIWTAHVDRSHLLQAGAIEAYAKDLKYEDDDDRKTLHLHIHQWIFAKAFANLRSSGDTNDARAGTLKALRQQTGPANTLAVRGRTHDTTPSNPPNEQRQNEESTLVEQETTNIRASPRITRSANQTKPDDKKRKNTSKNTTSSQPPTKKQKQREALPLAARHLTAALVAYFDSMKSDSVQEAQLLEHIEAEISLFATEATPLLGGNDYSDEFPQAMNSWLTYRHVILSVKNRAYAPLAPDSSEVRTKIMRVRLLNELRFARDAFVTKKTGSEMSNENYICYAFEKMQESKKDGKKVRQQIEKGMKVLDEKLLELGNELGRGEWAFMGVNL